MRIRLVGRYLCFLLWAEGVFMLPSALVALLHGEHHVLLAFLAAAAVCGAAGLVLFLLCRKARGTVYAREGFVVAGAGWVLVSLLGALPFFFSGEIPRYDNAFFESVAGFTTTGTFTNHNIEAWTRGLLFWRNFTQWLGGIGVLAFILIIVRGVGGGSQQLFRAESPGPQVGKVMPKTRDGVKYIFFVYLGLSVLCLTLLLAGRMPLFDALCTMFGIAGTGGFGVLNSSMAGYSVYLQVVCTLFMLLFGVNFTLYILVLRGGWRAAVRDEELRLYGGLVAGSVLLITLVLAVGGIFSVGGALHNASFMVSSVITSTGLSISDYGHWPALARSVLFVLMIVGAMGGSTAGGFKLGRLLILIKSLRAGLHRMLHPRSVTTIRYNTKPLGEEVLARTQMFLFVYCGIILLSLVLVSVDGQPLEQSLTAIIACLNNIGPGFGLVTTTDHFNTYSVFSKFVLAVNMLLGRLEIFPILVLLFPSTWKRKT